LDRGSIAVVEDPLLSNSVKISTDAWMRLKGDYPLFAFFLNLHYVKGWKGRVTLRPRYEKTEYYLKARSQSYQP
jgi:hypothetical protein